MNKSSQKIVGHKTMLDGSHEPLFEDEAAAIWASAKDADAQRRELMPDSMAALNILFDACVRLNDEGWRDGCSCPKDGSEFAIIQFGSTGIFSAAYSGTWPDGHVISGDFLHHVDGLLWKAPDALTDAERDTLLRCDEAERVMHEREIASFIAMDEAEP